jgi:hypothetical protein
VSDSNKKLEAECVEELPGFVVLLDELDDNAEVDDVHTAACRYL